MPQQLSSMAKSELMSTDDGISTCIEHTHHVIVRFDALGHCKIALHHVIARTEEAAL
jgi:hypothetical protein